MEHSTATRRLVKSPPELWAELSSEQSLRRHLAELGEIRITRTDPETTVAWEGDRVSGTVELAPTGWGTKVVLNAIAVGEAPAAKPTDRDRPPAAAAGPAPPRPEATRPGFLARLLRRRLQAPAGSIPAPPAPTPDPSPPTPAPAPGPVPPPAPDPTPPVPAPEPPPPPSIRAQALDPARTVEILSDVLDDLGSARHRPLSGD